MNFFIYFFVIFFISGCDSPKVNQNQDNRHQFGIIGGQPVSDQDLISHFVVGIYDKKTRFVCTGSLIRENLILTAAHCIECSPADVVIIFGLDFLAYDIKNLNFLRTASQIQIHPEFNSENTSDLDWNDIALIQFSGGQPEGYHPIEILKNKDKLKSGVSVQMAGFGATGVDLEDVTVKKDAKFKAALASGEIVCYDKNLNQCFRMTYLGDDKLRSTTGVIEGFTEKEIRMNESKGHGTCVGDSGGPLIYQFENTINLIGVTSRGSQFCDGPAIYTNVVEYVDWIEKTANDLK